MTTSKTIDTVRFSKAAEQEKIGYAMRIGDEAFDRATCRYAGGSAENDVVAVFVPGETTCSLTARTELGEIFLDVLG